MTLEHCWFLMNHLLSSTGVPAPTGAIDRKLRKLACIFNTTHSWSPSNLKKSCRIFLEFIRLLKLPIPSWRLKFLHEERKHHRGNEEAP
ncbi:hypothetical protein BofuT4_uP056860.1 [Botrytis cinerea T4]|uniref:Uncharacterized protein n=1 Tax=Botryotinia fuckeliana (strain T4) TaxID=999810 RepID=G2XWB5_BOTF4|nr:hypothetical protein BofuT4_uP056860.1 [Botrytis cinerea T4]